MPPQSSGGCRMRTGALELVEVDSEQLQELMRRVEQSLDQRDSTLIRRVFESYAYVTDLIDDKNTSIRHLRQLFFGSRTEKTEAVVGSKPVTSDVATSADAAAETASSADDGVPDISDAATASKGHGRNGAAAYRRAVRIDVPHPSLRAGDACPACGQGTVYDKAPGVLVRITGQPPLAATVYQLQKLRCHLCGEVFTADAPRRRGRRDEVRRDGRQHDRPLEVRQRTPVQPPRWPAGGPGSPAAGLDPVGYRACRGGEPRSGVR